LDSLNAGLVGGNRAPQGYYKKKKKAKASEGPGKTNRFFLSETLGAAETLKVG